jgi:hypothetical protein
MKPSATSIEYRLISEPIVRPSTYGRNEATNDLPTQPGNPASARAVSAPQPPQKHKRAAGHESRGLQSSGQRTEWTVSWPSARCQDFIANHLSRGSTDGSSRSCRPDPADFGNPEPASSRGPHSSVMGTSAYPAMAATSLSSCLASLAPSSGSFRSLSRCGWSDPTGRRGEVPGVEAGGPPPPRYACVGVAIDNLYEELALRPSMLRESSLCLPAGRWMNRTVGARRDGAATRSSPNYKRARELPPRHGDHAP